jgi:hypothetical protein
MVDSAATDTGAAGVKPETLDSIRAHAVSHQDDGTPCLNGVRVILRLCDEVERLQGLAPSKAGAE